MITNTCSIAQLRAGIEHLQKKLETAKEMTEYKGDDAEVTEEISDALDEIFYKTLDFSRAVYVFCNK